MMSGESSLVWFTHLEIISAPAAPLTTSQQSLRLPQVDPNITTYTFIPASSHPSSLPSQVESAVTDVFVVKLAELLSSAC